MRYSRSYVIAAFGEVVNPNVPVNSLPSIVFTGDIVSKVVFRFLNTLKHITTCQTNLTTSLNPADLEPMLYPARVNPLMGNPHPPPTLMPLKTIVSMTVLPLPTPL
jgi:hypothetical protein